MKSPIAFREWLIIVGIVFIAGVGLLLLKQLPFIDSLLNELSEIFNLQNEYVSSQHFYLLSHTP